MKITSTKLFEVSQIQDEDLRTNIGPLVDYINQLADQLIRMSNKQVNLTDNVACELYTVTLKQNAEKEILVKTPENIIGVTTIKAIANGINGLTWSISNSGALKVKCEFVIDKPTIVTVLVFYR